MYFKCLNFVSQLCFTVLWIEHSRNYHAALLRFFFLIWLDTKYLVMMALFQKSNVNEKCQVTYIGKSHNCFVRQVSKKRCQISIGSCQEAGHWTRNPKSIEPSSNQKPIKPGFFRSIFTRSIWLNLRSFK